MITRLINVFPVVRKSVFTGAIMSKRVKLSSNVVLVLLIVEVYEKLVDF